AALRRRMAGGFLALFLQMARLIASHDPVPHPGRRSDGLIPGSGTLVPPLRTTAGDRRDGRRHHAGTVAAWVACAPPARRVVSRSESCAACADRTTGPGLLYVSGRRHAGPRSLARQPSRGGSRQFHEHHATLYFRRDAGRLVAAAVGRTKY